MASATMAPLTEDTPAQLPNHKVKYKKAYQRACNEKDEKGKICAGHLKRWFYISDKIEQACGDVKAAYGPQAEIYRCEHCKTLYLPSPEEPSGKNVAGMGQKSIFGMTVVPKAAPGGDKSES